MKTKNFFIIPLLFAILFINSCANKEESTYVSELENSVHVDTLPLLKKDIAFFGTAVFQDTLFCIYREKSVDTLIIAPVLSEGKFGVAKKN